MLPGNLPPKESRKQFQTDNKQYMHIVDTRKTLALMLLLLMFFFTACSTHAKTRRSIKKKCDCRRWTEIMSPPPVTPLPVVCHSHC
jgi:hypothetical protein